VFPLKLAKIPKKCIKIKNGKHEMKYDGVVSYLQLAILKSVYWFEHMSHLKIQGKKLALFVVKTK